MILKEIRNVFECELIELHDAFSKKFIASTPKSLDEYNEVRIISAHPRIKVDSSEEWAKPYLFICGDSSDIKRIKDNRLL